MCCSLVSQGGGRYQSVCVCVCEAWDMLLTGESVWRRHQPVCVCVCEAWDMLLTGESGWRRHQPVCVCVCV